MKYMKCLLAIFFTTGIFSTGAIFAAIGDNTFNEELNERDFDALRDFLKQKRVVDVEENTSNLTISGDVRTEWRYLSESCCGKELFGHKSRELMGFYRSHNDFDIEFNLRFDYVCNRTWASVHVRYDNSAGVDDNGHPCKGTDDGSPCCSGGNCLERALACNGDPEGYHGSGKCDNLCLKRAYMGYNLYTCGKRKLDVELGRRGSLYNVFDSNIQFLSRFDGILVRYIDKDNKLADWYIQGAGFVIDEKVNHFGWIVEIGLLDIYDSRIDFKYSFIDWQKNGRNRCLKRDPVGFNFLNSQWRLAYNLDPDCFYGIPAKFYAAFLWNAAAKKIHNIICEDKIVKINRHLNIGWYAGVLIGDVEKEGDWSVEVMYQFVEAQAVPDGDVGGIGRGNQLDTSFTTCSYMGNANFKGWTIDALYGITDDLVLEAIVEWSKAINDKVGGKHTYSKFELEAVYAF